jgi:broad specificity phosphatase PhoE
VTRLHLVRHAEAAAGWDSDVDPGLGEVGVRQAAAVAERLAPLGPLPVVTSPMRRCRETAEPLLARWGVAPVVDPRVGEIPSPSDDLSERAAWLRQAMGGSWADLGERWHRWRTSLLAALLETRSEAVVVTHFVAINTAIGLATGDDRVVIERPANASVTVLAHDGEHLRLIAPPDEAGTTQVL